MVLGYNKVLKEPVCCTGSFLIDSYPAIEDNKLLKLKTGEMWQI